MSVRHSCSVACIRTISSLRKKSRFLTILFVFVSNVRNSKVGRFGCFTHKKAFSGQDLPGHAAGGGSLLHASRHVFEDHKEMGRDGRGGRKERKWKGYGKGRAEGSDGKVRGGWGLGKVWGGSIEWGEQKGGV